MDYEMIMPRIDAEMSEGQIIKWRKVEGSKVNKGEIIVEIETGKVTMEIESPYTGVLKLVKVKEGEAANIGDVIAVISNNQ